MYRQEIYLCLKRHNYATRWNSFQDVVCVRVVIYLKATHGQWG